MSDANALSFTQWTDDFLKDHGLDDLPYVGSIADMGCGFGTLLHHFSLRYTGARYVGIDRDRKILEAARRHYPCLEFCEADIRDTGLGDSSVGVLTSTGVFDYLDSRSEQEYAEEVGRVLVDGGIYCPFEMRLRKRTLDCFARLDLVPIRWLSFIVFQKRSS